MLRRRLIYHIDGLTVKLVHHSLIADIFILDTVVLDTVVVLFHFQGIVYVVEVNEKRLLEGLDEVGIDFFCEISLDLD